MCQICCFCNFKGSRFWVSWFFCTFWRLKLTKFSIFRAPRITKTAVLKLLDSSKLISRKIWGPDKINHAVSKAPDLVFGKCQLSKIAKNWFHVKSEWKKIVKFPHCVYLLIILTRDELSLAVKSPPIFMVWIYNF